jgi:hypothetical protein
MQRYSMALLILQVMVLTACSAHPLPEDVTRKSTFAIVQQLRCEARAGIIAANLPQSILDNTYIGFDFTFDITEINKATSGFLGFTNPVSGGKFLLDFNGGVDKTRQAERFFRVVQLFAELRNDENCRHDTQRANLIYPITGKVGLAEVVQTYTSLKAVTKLRTKDGSVFSDTLTFTSKLNAGITPTLEVSAGGNHFKLTKASIDGSVERTDIHKVVIAIAGKTDVTDIARMNIMTFSRSGPSPGLATGAAGVILELDRLRSRGDDARALEALRLLQ